MNTPLRIALAQCGIGFATSSSRISNLAHELLLAIISTAVKSSEYQSNVPIGLSQVSFLWRNLMTSTRSLLTRFDLSGLQHPFNKERLELILRSSGESLLDYRVCDDTDIDDMYRFLDDPQSTIFDRVVFLMIDGRDFLEDLGVTESVFAEIKSKAIRFPKLESLHVCDFCATLGFYHCFFDDYDISFPRLSSLHMTSFDMRPGTSVGSHLLQLTLSSCVITTRTWNTLAKDSPSLAELSVNSVGWEAADTIYRAEHITLADLRKLEIWKCDHDTFDRIFTYVHAPKLLDLGVCFEVPEDAELELLNAWIDQEEALV